MKTELRRRLE